MSSRAKSEKREVRGASRREFLKTVTVGAAAAAGVPGAAKAFDIEEFFQQNFRELSDSDIEDVVARLSRKYTEKYGKDVTVDATGPIDGVVYGYGLDISRCIGCRRCVYACVEENNQSRAPQIQYIRVLEMPRGTLDTEQGNHDYDHPTDDHPNRPRLRLGSGHAGQRRRANHPG